MKKTGNSAAYHTMGCKLNYAETSTIARNMEAAGYEKVSFDDSADWYVINTCTVTENADREFRKLVNRIHRRSPESKIAVIGCYAQLQPDTIAQSKVNLILGARNKFDLPSIIQQVSRKDEPVIKSNSGVADLHSCESSYSLGDRTRSFLKIQDGCDYPCTYCTIPLARGKSRSMSPEAVLRQAQEIASAGVREIVLTGVNVGDYRSDATDLLGLLKMLESVKRIQRYRISSIEPNLLTDGIIKFVAGSDKFLPHFHIPLQSGSDKILGLMKRRYGASLFENRVETVLAHIPDAAIGVDVIVGFPGETEEDFRHTHDLLASLDISYLHVFTYSERPNTPAVDYSGVVDKSIRRERNKLLTQLSDAKHEKYSLGFLGQPAEVLLESKREGIFSGMTEHYVKVKLEGDEKLSVNQIVKVSIVSYSDGVLWAKPAE